MGVGVGLGVAVGLDVGVGAEGDTVMTNSTLLVAPSSSVTVRVTVYSPGVM